MLRLLSLTGLAVMLAGGAVTVWAAIYGPDEIAHQQACMDSPTAIHVTVQEVRSSDGVLTALLFDDDPDSFLKEGKGIDKARVPAKTGNTKICLKAPGPGTYSIALYHDENGNRKFERNFLGIPSEGYGFSRNPGFAFSPPEVEEIAFDVTEQPVTLDISLRYLIN